MSSVNDARKAVYDRFIAQWPGLTSDTAFTFENEKFTPPEGAAWARLSVQNQESVQETLGPPGQRRFRRSAVVFVQVFVPGDTGTAESDALVTSCRGIFEGVSFEGLDFHAVSSTETGVDNGQHMTLVEAPFEYEDRK